jgi:hypothetical protein
MKRVALLGSALAFLYLAVVVGTGHLASRPVRPLFDSIGPPPAYRWVKPPPDFAASNVAPKKNESSVTLTKTGSPQSAGASEDSQFVWGLPASAVPAKDGEQQFVARITPLDPDKLGAPPAKLYADGNAYQLTFNYQPSETPITTFASPGTLTVTVPVPADTVLYSPDGKTWQAVSTEHISATTVGATLPAPGYFMASTPDLSSLVPKKSGSSLVAPVIIVAVLAGVLLLVPWLVMRRRRQASQGRQARRQAARKKSKR